ncbi:ExbD/TolR family protein [Rubritalea tangerina]|uniref:ExbD/TolR family protein n=1 Tax=Rubritalea tangerina TaxID=430798 RepID=A0ABW4Z8W2_9BACT
MRIKRKGGSDEDGVEVSMSPLIDCVFLLLIFFLVTTMLKKTERRIPIQQPVAELSLATRAQNDAQYIGITEEGALMQPNGRMDAFGNRLYDPIGDLKLHLQQLAAQGGQEKPLVIQANKNLYFQETLKVFDICTIQGFKNVKVTMDSDNFQSIYRKGGDETSE